MKKLNIKKNGNFSVVSHRYVLYGRKLLNSAYVHVEDAYGTTYMVDDIDWKDIILLVRDKISWKEFISIIAYWNDIQEQFEDYYNL